MQNLTILSFVSSMYISNSPTFINNLQLSCMQCYFMRFTFIQFFNQNNLLIKRSTFREGLGSIIYNKQNIHETFENLVFIEPIKIEKESKRSISIINCYFSNITSSHAIFIDRDTISIYITSSSFISCVTGQNGVILLSRARCLTMTHVCTYQSGSYAEGGILNYDCRDIDFSICTYNTFVDSLTNDVENSFTIFVRSGSQFYRCTNLTGTVGGGFHFSAPDCFSFALTTVMKCSKSCILISGYALDQISKDKTIEMVNFFSNYEYLLKLSGESPFKLTIQNSVLLNNYNDARLFQKETFLEITIEVRNCIILDKYSSDDYVMFIDCTSVNYDVNYLTLYPHYTFEDKCVGVKRPEEENAYGCNAGNCVDLLCNKSIGFPEDVIPYTTIIHFDLQTATFSSSSKFSESEQFSDSIKFSRSNQFSATKQFTYSDKFSTSNQFSHSNQFFETKQFSHSNQFFTTKQFSHSNQFFATKQFSCSNKFSHSNQYSRSNQFSTSNQFSCSNKFSETNQFFELTKFIYTHIVDSKNEFSKSIFFSNSKTFTQTPFQSDLSDDLTFSLSIIESLTNIKTVIFSYSLTISFIDIECFDLQSLITICKTQTYHQHIFPYIIYSLSPIYVKTYFSYEFNTAKKMITPEQMIGIVCGSFAIFFSIIGIIILIIKKRNEIKCECEEFDISSDEDINYITEEKSVNMNNISNDINNVKIDDWL